MPTHLHRFLSSFEDRLKELETEFHKAWWDSQIAADPEADRRRAGIEIELRRIKGDPDALDKVDRALADEIHDPLLRRQVELLRFSLLPNQMDENMRIRLVDLSTSIESEFASHRPTVDGRRLSENEVVDILRNSDDGDLRRRVWEASKEIGRLVADRIRELVRIRNDVAHRLGFADYYRMSLELQEIPEEWLFDLLDQLDDLTADPFRGWKTRLDEKLRARFSTADLRPWHYSDPFFQEVPPDVTVDLDPLVEGLSIESLVLNTFGAWGIDLTPVLAASDLYPRENKCQHAFCLDVDRSGRDVRILANVVPGTHWTEVMLHESGHAAYDVSIDEHLPYLLHHPAHTFVTEAIALLSGRLVHHPSWLTSSAGVSEDAVAGLRRQLAAASVARCLLFARWGLVMVHFERDLYSDPEADLDARWWELVERFQGVSPPPDRSAPDWAAKIHLGSAPVYYQNYLLGELLASQLETTCYERFGGIVNNDDAGAFLVDEVFKPGASKRWDDLVASATGEELSPKHFAAAVSTDA